VILMIIVGVMNNAVSGAAPISSAEGRIDSPWAVASAIATAVATCALAILAVFALSAALGQLKAVKTERTVKLIDEISSPDIENLLGFFDYAADIRVSRAAVKMLYFKLLESRPPELRTKRVQDVDHSASGIAALMLRDLNEELKGDKVKQSAVTDARREVELRKRVLQAMNLLERSAILADSRLIDADILLDAHDYNIAATYYVLEPILEYFVQHENFQFEPARHYALAALAHVKMWIAKDHALADANFHPLLRDKATG
jgi:hypothetical protein